MPNHTLKQLGPFAQLLTLTQLPKAGPISDEAMHVLEDVWIVMENGVIKQLAKAPLDDITTETLEAPVVATPGLIDAHTHACYAGSRAGDYARRVAGMSYQEIAAKGGGILDSVTHTRRAIQQQLTESLLSRLDQLAKCGVTTVEVKSGYGLSVSEESKILRAIRSASDKHKTTIIPTCLAAHTTPPEAESADAYLRELHTNLLPLIRDEQLAARVDIFVEEGAFSVDQARKYLGKAKALGFALTVHADQFSRGGALLAAELKALSADHLEQSNDEDFKALRDADVTPVMLPGATLGLGQPFPPARQALDAGLPLVIASDWNPGSAPMGHLLTQAALLGAAQKLTMAETWAALTFRAARALDLNDRGMLWSGQRADIAIWPTEDWREILYHQGALRPSMTVAGGERIA